MKSLAVLVVVLLLIATLSGPIAIALSTPRLRFAINSHHGLGWMLLDISRKIIHLLAIISGWLIGSQLLIHTAPLGTRLFGLVVIATCYIGFRREYFPDFYIVKKLFNAIGIKAQEEAPIYSADGTEIIRAKKARRLGRSSGRDGHGPSGQH
jgi:hypothetical protein